MNQKQFYKQLFNNLKLSAIWLTLFALLASSFTIINLRKELKTTEMMLDNCRTNLDSILDQFDLEYIILMRKEK